MLESRVQTMASMMSSRRSVIGSDEAGKRFAANARSISYTHRRAFSGPLELLLLKAVYKQGRVIIMIRSAIY